MAPKKPKTLTLTQALSQFLSKTLLPDLEARATESAIAAALSHQYEAEVKAERTAESLREFVERTLEQVGAAWILSCVFVRVLEDRKLLSRNRIAGDGALDSEQLFFELAPSLTARDYLFMVFQEVASLPGVVDVLGPAHNPAFRFSPSNDGARALLEFFRARDAEGALRWQFAGQDTRFLGDLYQDLSEHVRKRYALLQTPGFVEAFILDQTLTPAIAEFGLETVRVIDPTCGSGHFVLGAFERLLEARLRAAPGVDVRTHALASLGQVYGVDVNPYAVAIARFRLTLAYLERCGFTRLSQAPKLQLNLVVADSLLHGAQNKSLLFTEHESARGDEEAWGLPLFALDDPAGAQRVFGQRYHAVVGNPPYITCKDAKLRELYRAYVSAYGKYSLAAPFTERFFQLAVDGGFVGMINANSFMKREFGKALITQVLKNLDLTRVIDSAGAYIPGHGTPTVLLFGRNRKPSTTHVSAVLGKRGEPATPEDAERGLVWRSIVDHFDDVGFENEYVSVAQVVRVTLDEHPWSLGGGRAAELKELLEERAENTLGRVAEEIGFASFPGLDEAFILPFNAVATLGIENAVRRPMVVGEDVRDWAIAASDLAITPYDPSTHRPLPLDKDSRWARFLWRYRTVAKNVSSFGGKSRAEEGQNWWEWYRWQRERYACPLRIVFAEVATHNHFVLDRGGKVFKQTAPIIKLPESATEDDHLALLAYLNSSTACFWMKQVCYPKSTHSEMRPEKGIPEDNRYAFSGTAIGSLPVPELSELKAALPLVRRMEQAAKERVECQPEAVVRCWVESSSNSSIRTDVAAGESREKATLRRLVGLQEDLDWLIYAVFRLVERSEAPSASTKIGCEPAERPFLTTDVIEAGDNPGQSIWRARRDLIRRGPTIRFLEDPVYKRRWWGARGVFASKVATYNERARAACILVTLERIERHLAALPQPVTISSALLQRIAKAEDLLSYARPDHDHVRTAQVEVLRDALPYVRALCYSEAGLATFADWETIWKLQAREDLSETVAQIPVPPNYDVKDFRDANYFRLRGKLDVPKERFICYPGCQKDGDDSPLIGWAGWNHLQRAQALISLYQERKTEDGWPTERLMPMLVGLHELMFWLELWHSQPEAGSQNPAREVRQYLDAELSSHRLTTGDLEAWRPETKKAAKARKATKKALA